MGHQIATRQQKIESSVQHLRNVVNRKMPAIQSAVPDHVRPEKMARCLFNMLLDKPEIALECEPESIVGCLVKAATYGLEIATGEVGHAYVIARKDWKLKNEPKKKRAHLQLSYKGRMYLTRNAGYRISSKVVHEGDEYEFLGDDEKPLHRPAREGNRREQKILFAYAYAKEIATGEIYALDMSYDEIIATRNTHSESWKNRDPKKELDQLWHPANPNHWKMCRKTVIIALCGSGEINLSADKVKNDALTDFITGDRDVVVPRPAPKPQIEAETEAPEPGVVDAESKPVEPETEPPEPETEPAKPKDITDKAETIEEVMVLAKSAVGNCKTPEQAGEQFDMYLADYPQFEKELQNIFMPKIAEGDK